MGTIGEGDGSDPAVLGGVTARVGDIDESGDCGPTIYRVRDSLCPHETERAVWQARVPGLRTAFQSEQFEQKGEKKVAPVELRHTDFLPDSQGSFQRDVLPAFKCHRT